MVKLQPPGVALNGLDATDALAIALCHAHYGCSQNRYMVAIERQSHDRAAVREN